MAAQKIRWFPFVLEAGKLVVGPAIGLQRLLAWRRTRKPGIVKAHTSCAKVSGPAPDSTPS